MRLVFLPRARAPDTVEYLCLEEKRKNTLHAGLVPALRRSPCFDFVLATRPSASPIVRRAVGSSCHDKWARTASDIKAHQKKPVFYLFYIILKKKTIVNSKIEQTNNILINLIIMLLQEFSKYTKNSRTAFSSNLYHKS